MQETPAWQVGAWELAADLAKIDQQWGALREILESAELYDRRDSEISGWSCGEHAGHLVLVTRWIADGIEENLKRPERDTDGAWAEYTEAILVAGDFPRGVAQSPSRVDPHARPREDFLPLLPEAVAAWESVAEKAEQLPSCPARFAHFALGYLTSTEWVRFCALHSAHHLAVVRDLRAPEDVEPSDAPLTGDADG